jgi:hypothetical protein
MAECGTRLFLEVTTIHFYQTSPISFTWYVLAKISAYGRSILKSLQACFINQLFSYFYVPSLFPHFKRISYSSSRIDFAVRPISVGYFF